MAGVCWEPFNPAVHGSPANQQMAQRLWLEKARAAVQALMEPDEGQMDEGYDATRLADGTPQFAKAGFCIGHSRTIYQAMLRPLVEGEGE